VPSSTRHFSHEVYSPEAIAATRDAYSEVTEVTIQSSESGTDATFSDEGLVVDAFCNHALFLSIQAFRSSEAS